MHESQVMMCQISGLFTFALRQTSSGVLLGSLFYLPMAVPAVPPH